MSSQHTEQLGSSNMNKGGNWRNCHPPQQPNGQGHPTSITRAQTTKMPHQKDEWLTIRHQGQSTDAQWCKNVPAESVTWLWEYRVLYWQEVHERQWNTNQKDCHTGAGPQCRWDVKQEWVHNRLCIPQTEHWGSHRTARVCCCQLRNAWPLYRSQMVETP